MKKVLVLGAHLDDSVIAMGGTIVKLVRSGAEVSVFCIGNGDEAYVTPGRQAEAVRAFKQSAQEAHRILGVKNLECADAGDFEVDAPAPFYRLCIGAIRKYQPDIIFGHWPAEYFQHHGMAKMSIDAWNQARWNCSADYGTVPWTARKYFHFGVTELLPEPSHLVDISEEFEIQMKALSAFDPEGGHLSGWQDKKEAKARYFGSLIGVKYAEAFKQSSYLPAKVSDTDIFFI